MPDSRAPAWQALPVDDPSGLLLQREGHASCVLSSPPSAQGADRHLVIVGGYSANGDSSDIVAVSISGHADGERSSEIVESGLESSPHPLSGVCGVIGSSRVTARDGAVLHSLPMLSGNTLECVTSVAIGFGGIDLDSYEHVGTCFMVEMARASTNTTICTDEPVPLTAKAHAIQCLADEEHGCPRARCRPSSSMIVRMEETSSPLSDFVRIGTTPNGDGGECDNMDVDTNGGDEFPAGVVIPTNWALVVFGGEDGEGNVLNDLWVLRAKAVSVKPSAERDVPLEGVLYWTRVMCAEDSSITDSPWPEARYLAAMPKTITASPAADSVSLLMYGGASYSREGSVESMRDVWEAAIALRWDGRPIHVEWKQVPSDNLLPKCNGHVGAITKYGTMFFGGKDFAEGNDDIHVFSKVEPQSQSGDEDRTYHYRRFVCPYANDISSYVNTDEDVGGTGKGLWPHWRFTATIDHVGIDGKNYMMLTCGECRHNDVASIYLMCDN